MDLLKRLGAVGSYWDSFCASSSLLISSLSDLGGLVVSRAEPINERKLSVVCVRYLGNR